MQFISLLTDFGLTQEYAGVCKAVILSICPSATIVDISHSGSPFDIEEAAFMLKNFVVYSPAGVHVVVVDPGVGTERRGIAVETERGDILVGPDNGVLTEAVKVLTFKKAVGLENKKYMLESISSSFHGRDVFAPCAAYILKGVPVTELGRTLDEKELNHLEIVTPHEDEKTVYGKVLRIDRFGNIQLNVPAQKIPEKKEVILEIKGKQLVLPYVKTFGEVDKGELLIYKDSDGLLTVSQNQGNASQLLNVRKPMEVLILKS